MIMMMMIMMLIKIIVMNVKMPNKITRTTMPTIRNSPSILHTQKMTMAPKNNNSNKIRK